MNPALKTLIRANRTNYKEVKKKLQLFQGQIKRYGPGEHLTYKFKLIVKMGEAGLTVPYHHRPRCKECGTYFLPNHHRRRYCPECGGYPGYSLTPSDLMELGFDARDAALALGWPTVKPILKLLNNWNPEEEDKNLDRVRRILREPLGQ